jgi:hypothetical protein
MMLPTDVVASYLNGRADAVALIQHLLPDGLALCVITVGEIYEGIYVGRYPARVPSTGTRPHPALAFADQALRGGGHARRL